MNFGDWKDHGDCSLIRKLKEKLYTKRMQGNEKKEKLYTKRMQGNERLIVSGACDYKVLRCVTYLYMRVALD
jgi:hypothetical protein